MLSNEPNDSFLLFAIAKEYEKNENFSLAKEYFQKLYESNPEYVGLYYHFAQVHVDLDDIPAAFKMYNEGIEMAKKQKDFHALSELMNAKTNLEME